MTDIFISYSKKDRKIVASIADELERAGYSVWWDPQLIGGDEFRDAIVDQINAAKVSIVVWSRHSVESPWVRSEAEIARKRNTLLPLHVPGIDPTTIPPPFGVLHSIDATDTATVLASLSAKIELDDRTRARVTAEKQRRRRTKLITMAILGMVAATAAIALFASPSLRAALEGSIRRVYYRLNPCEEMTVFVNFEGQDKRICVSASEHAAFQDCRDCPEMVIVHGGRFFIGSPENEQGRDVDERQTQVEVGSFAIGRYEITVGQWQACVDAGACRLGPQPAQLINDKYPASFLSWEDTQDYVRWLSARAERKYRLPTEAEWEFAARAGTSEPRFWGPVPSKACEYGNVNDWSYQRSLPASGTTGSRATVGALDFHSCDDSYPRLAPVGEFKANGFTLYDVIGNVWEWVEDCAFPNYDALPRDGSAYAPADCQVRMLRGGSFMSNPASARSANRYQGGRNRSNAHPDFGFRVARELE